MHAYGAITEIDGLRIGHYTDTVAKTGCTVVICDNGCVAGVDVRGSAPGTRETDLLRGYNSVDKIHAVMLAGGSAFGLDAASGAMQYLEEQHIGFDVGVTVVPIVPAAVIFDLTVGDGKVRPNKQNGYDACVRAAKEFEAGAVGAGTGATVGKAYGMEYCMQSGVGTACIELDGGIKLGAIVVVNALGDVYDPDTGRIVAGAKRDGKFISQQSSGNGMNASFGNTTISVIATNAALDREQANKLAAMAHDGYALAIRPVHTSLDGDTVFAMATGETKEYDFLKIMCAAPKVMSLAILDAVKVDNTGKSV